MKKISIYLIVILVVSGFFYLNSQRRPSQWKIKKLVSGYVNAVANNNFEEAKAFIHPSCLTYYDKLGIMLPKIMFESSVSSFGNRLCKQDIKELVISVKSVSKEELVEAQLIKERYGVKNVWIVYFYCPYADYIGSFFLAKDNKNKKWYLLLLAYTTSEIMEIPPELDDSSMYRMKQMFDWHTQQRKIWLSGSGE